MSNNSVYDIAIVQSRLFGDSKGNHFNDLEEVIGYPASITVNVNRPLVELMVMHGEVVDGIRFSYLRNDNQTVDIVPHGTSENSTDPELNETKVTLDTYENIIAITGRLRNDNQTVDIPHGTSENSTDPELNKTKVTLDTYENIIAITGRHGQTDAFGIRMTQISFVIYDSSTGISRIAGPFGQGLSGQPFRVTANGNFVACGGFAVDTNSSLGQLYAAGEDGGLYGLVFEEIAYRNA